MLQRTAATYLAPDGPWPDNVRVTHVGRWVARLLVLVGIPALFIIGLVLWTWGGRIWVTTFALAIVLLVAGRLFELWTTRKRRPTWRSIRLHIERS